MLIGAIVAAEVAFWVFLLAGLGARYLLGRPGLGLILLLGSPAADLALLALAGAHILGGAPPTQAHALAASYLGFTVAFGGRAVAWADQRFARRFAGRAVPAGPVRAERVQREWALFRRASLGWAVTSVLLLGLTGLAALAGNLGRAGALVGYLGVLTVALVIWLLAGPVRAVLSESKGENHMPEPQQEKPPRRGGWAPWWAYLVVILGANYARQLAIPAGAIPGWAIVLIAAAISATMFGLVTAAYRATRH
jgi:hypothetical protein